MCTIIYLLDVDDNTYVEHRFILEFTRNCTQCTIIKQTFFYGITNGLVVYYPASYSSNCACPNVLLLNLITPTNIFTSKCVCGH